MNFYYLHIPEISLNLSLDGEDYSHSVELGKKVVIPISKKEYEHYLACIKSDNPDLRPKVAGKMEIVAGE